MFDYIVKPGQEMNGELNLSHCKGILCKFSLYESL